MRKVVFMIDGWFMRKRVRSLEAFEYNGPEIRKYCERHLKKEKEDYLYRIFYYDSAPFDKKGTNPITKKLINFRNTAVAKTQRELFESIKKTPHFALRLGSTIWKGNIWILRPGKLKALLNKTISVDDLKGGDVTPLIQQKAVDMKIGLDITSVATKRVADLLIVITGDADIVPALKFARREGMQVGLDPLLMKVQPALSEHVDFIDSKIKKPKKS